MQIQESLYTNVDLKKLTGKLNKPKPELNQLVADIFQKTPQQFAEGLKRPERPIEVNESAVKYAVQFNTEIMGFEREAMQYLKK